MLTVQERVAAGIKFLNEKYPNWLRHIDIKKLDVRNHELCVIGQLLGSFLRIQDIMPDYMVMTWKLGFDASGNSPNPHRDFEDLTKEWKRQLTELRTNPQRMGEDEWAEKFKPVPNRINAYAGWNFGGRRGCLFETYGKEFEFVKAQATNRVWTLIDGDEGGQFIVSGLHYVNRVGYFVTANPLPSDCDVEVVIEEIE